MSNLVRIGCAFGMLGALAFVMGIYGPSNANSQDKSANPKKADEKTAGPAESAQSQFMRKKLEASDQILEGLVTEDNDLIIKGAQALVEMSAAEKWQVKHDVMYKQFSNEFQQSAKRLVEAAKSDNFDGAALKWIDTTMKCIECHKYVRGARLATK